jgi:hypothetical protein
MSSHQSAHGQLYQSHNQSQVQSHGHQLQHIQSQYHPNSLTSSFAQSAPPTVTSFTGIHSPVTSPPLPPPPYSSYGQNVCYAPPSTAGFGQSFLHQQQQQQQAYSQSVNNGLGGAQHQQHSSSMNASGNGAFHPYLNSAFGLMPSSGFATTSDTLRSPPPPPTPSSGQPVPMSGVPQHYYHSGLPSPTDDFRKMHVGASQAPRSASSISYSPYPLQAQFHRPPPSSIYATNPDNLPDLRYSDAPLSATAQYGRLPDGKIIELYPAMMRTIQACEYCRSRKAKCTGGSPCERCQKKNVKCEYAQLDKKRKVKTTTSQFDLSSAAANGRHNDHSGQGGRAQTLLSAKTAASRLKTTTASDSCGNGKSNAVKEDRMQLRSSARPNASAMTRSRNLELPILQETVMQQVQPSSSFESIAQWQAMVTPSPLHGHPTISSQSSDRGSPAIHPTLLSSHEWHQDYTSTPLTSVRSLGASPNCQQRRLSGAGVQASQYEDDTGSSPLDHNYDLYT